MNARNNDFIDKLDRKTLAELLANGTSLFPLCVRQILGSFFHFSPVLLFSILLLSLPSYLIILNSACYLFLIKILLLFQFIFLTACSALTFCLMTLFSGLVCLSPSRGVTPSTISLPLCLSLATLFVIFVNPF